MWAGAQLYAGFLLSTTCWPRVQLSNTYGPVPTGCCPNSFPCFLTAAGETMAR